MTPTDLIQGRTAPLRLVIFDCDGVIVDSEGVSSRVTSRAVSELGWLLSPAEAEREFLGMTLPDMIPVVEARTGRALPSDWTDRLVDRLATALQTEATPIPGALEALAATSALGIPWRIATNSGPEELEAKFACLGIAELTSGRTHNFTQVARGKPAPDLFLAAAAAQGVLPRECLVIEDSVPGARAARAAGMDCLGYAPHGDDGRLRSVGAVPFASMFELPALFAAAVKVSA